ncbi:MAG: SGNH/GDSL hydrolase family protein, partial [Paraclostridium sp.]
QGPGPNPDPEPPTGDDNIETPIGDVIDAIFTSSTLSAGNNVTYELNSDNTLKFTKSGVEGRLTVFTKPLKSIKFKALTALDWITVFENEEGNVGNGFYANNPGQFGYVTFNGYGAGSYVFAEEKPSFASIKANDIVEFRYSAATCGIYINTKHVGDIPKSAYTTVVDVARVGFKIDSNVSSSGHTPVKILSATFDNTKQLYSDYGYGLTQKLEKAIDHIKYIYTKLNNGAGVQNPFKGKSASAIGDSITADGSYLTPLKNTLELASIQNLGVGGQGYTGGTFLGQVSNINSSSSLIIMSGGVNDFRVNKPLGEPSDMENANTFYGALYLTFKKLAELHSDKKIVVATFHNNKEHVHTMYPAWDKPNSLGLYAWDYIEAMKQRAKMFGFPVADVYGESGINVQDHCTTDGIHLNGEGGSRMAEIIKDTVLTKPYYKF